MIEIHLDDRDILTALQQLQQATGDLSPAFREIGEALSESTRHRFETTTDPAGNPWLLNSVLSTLLYKDGDRPLTGETGALMDSIHYQLVGNDQVEIGSPMEYAAMQQFGGTKAEFPHLWGDIPARPFLGISEDDKTEIMDIIQAHLKNAI